MTRRLSTGILCFAIVWLAIPQATSLGESPDVPPAVPDPAQLASAPVPEAPVAPTEKPTAAERISRLERSIEADEKRTLALKASLTDPNGEYAQAEASFRELDVERGERQQQLKAAEETGSTENWARLQEAAASLEKKWHLAKERFDLAIAERKGVQESLVTLERKLQSDRDTLARLRGEKDTPETAAVAAAPPAATPAAPQVAATTPIAAPAAASEPAAPAAAPSAMDMLPQTALAKAVGVGTEAPAAAPASAVSKRVAAELTAARSKAQASIDAATDAEAEAQALTERIQILQQDVEQQRKLRDTARKKVDNAEQTLKSQNEELFQKLMAGENIANLKQQVRDTTSRLIEARQSSRDIATHLDDLQSTLALLQSEQFAAMKVATAKREEAQLAQAKVDDLQNPFAVRNLLQWLLDHGPRIAVILIAFSACLWMIRVFETKLVALIARRGRRGSREDRENRAKTLIGVFNNVAKLFIIGSGSLMLLNEIGISVTPVIGGAAVVGLAVAFGAQSLIKDYFTGFMVLFEQQYLINDVIRIGDIAGQVERISLRMTVLRDMEGRVHFIPHGQINTVTNLTHGWSRAVFEIGVAYKERVDDVIDVLKRLAAELRQDDTYRFLILDEPVMLGVDSLANSAVVVKFYIQTRPLQQWTIKREMLRRIKNEFDRLGIEIPFPHVTVYQGVARPAESAGEDDGDQNWTRRGVA